MAERLPPTTATLVAVDDRTCLLDLGGDRLDRLLADLCALDVEFDVVEGPDALRDALRTMARRLQRHL